MERFPSHTPSATPEQVNKNRESLRDELFDQLIAEKVIVSFTDDLALADFDEDTIVEIERELEKLPENEKKMVLAIPAQLRIPLFKRYARSIEEGEMTGSGMVHNILMNAKKHGYTLGFHLSLYDIRAEKDGSWYVRGTEKDHRHEDRPMAYYSMDYSHRYKEKRTKYLYVVRAETGEETSHYRDNDGSWGHASTLSIVERVEFEDVEKALNDRMKKIEQKQSEGDA